MTAEELKAFLETNKEEIQTAVKAKVIAGLIESHRWDISEQVTKVVSEFVAAEIVPEVRKYLADQKGPLVQAALTATAEVGDTLAKSITTSVAKRLAPDGYEFRQVMTALFG